MLASKCQGDTWALINELIKVNAGGQSVIAEEELNMFNIIEAVNRDDKKRWSKLRRLEDSDGVILLGLREARMLALYRAGSTQGIQPFILNKLAQLKGLQVDKLLNLYAESIILTRSGYGSPEEVLEALSAN